MLNQFSTHGVSELAPTDSVRRSIWIVVVALYIGGVMKKCTRPPMPKTMQIAAARRQRRRTISR
jgi:hypothetical protein